MVEAKQSFIENDKLGKLNNYENSQTYRLLETSEVNCKRALILTRAKCEHGDIGNGWNHHEASKA